MTYGPEVYGDDEAYTNHALWAAARAHQAQDKVALPSCWEDPCQFPPHLKDKDGNPRECYGKRPLLPRWRDITSVTPEQIDGWWTTWPFANVGIATGGISNQVTIDVDGEEGEASLKKLEKALGKLPRTREVKTKRGRHLHFNDPGVKIQTRKGADFRTWNEDHEPAPGLDVRGEGGFVVMPPSRNRDWINDLPQADLPAAWIGPMHESASPEHLPDDEMGEALALLKTEGKPCSCVLEITKKQGLDHHQGMRDAQWALLELGRKGHPGVGQAMDQLQEAYGDDHDWFRALDGAVANAMDQEQGEPGCSLDKLAVARAQRKEKDEELSPAAQAMVEKMAAKRVAEEQEVQKEAALFMDGETFLRQAMVTSPPIWGSQAMDLHLWERGESLMLVGPPGVGKSTLAHLLVWARLGLLHEVIDWPVEPGKGKVLYLAMDRPAQIGRAMMRLVREDQWAILRDRLIVRMGPLPVDITQEITWIRDTALELGVDLVVIDSIKDVLPKASDEQQAGLYNMARQACLASGVDWMELHHNRKAGVGNKEPDTLEDVYGARWLTAGAGSVISLYGESGASVVSMKQLKTPAGEFFPRWVELRKDTGMLLLHGDDLTVETFLAKSPRGTNALLIARKIYGTEKPDRNQIQNVRNKLKRLVAAGEAEEFESPVDKGQMFRPVTDSRVSNFPATPHQRDGATPATDEVNAQVRGATPDSNSSNAQATFRGSLKEPGVAVVGEEVESDRFAEARQRFPDKSKKKKTNTRRNKT